MTYICFVESKAHSVPHMEPLTALTAEEARQEALQLLRRHKSAVSAHVFKGDNRVHSLSADDHPG